MVNLIGKSSQFAISAHGDQKYGRKPYHAHLMDVVNVIRRFVDWDDINQELIDAAWLHDVVEDTSITLAEVSTIFGPRVAELVHAVTNEKGENRKERHAKTYPKIRDTEGALRLKLADRIANVEQSISQDRFGRPPQKLFKMYDKEWESFNQELRGRCKGEGAVEENMWAYLSELMQEGRDMLEQYEDLKTFRGLTAQ